MIDSFDFSDTDEKFGKNKKEPITRATAVRQHEEKDENNYRNYRNNRPNNRPYDNRTHDKPFNTFNSISNSYRKTQIPYKLTSNSPASTTVTATYKRPFAQRSYYSRNYKEQAEKPLPKFTFGNTNTGTTANYRKNQNDFEIQGYRDPSKMKNYGGVRVTKPIIHKNITKTYSSPRINERELTFDDNFKNSTCNNQNSTCNNQNITCNNQNSNSNNQNSTCNANNQQSQQVQQSPKLQTQTQIPVQQQYFYSFKIKFVDSYRDFCRIKTKSSLNLESKYESISFLKSIAREDKLTIYVFLDRIERVFYGAAAVSLDELVNKEEIDTYTLESMLLRLNWIYLSEVEESELGTRRRLEVTDNLDMESGMKLLELMEQSETQLHDVKKIRPVKLKMKTTRLDELEEFFRLTEGGERGKTEQSCIAEECEFFSETEPMTEQNEPEVQVQVQSESDSSIKSVESDDDFFADYE